MTHPAIEVAGLSKRYADRLAVEDVSFTVDFGSVVGLLGPNGAGKTTTLKTLVGVAAPTLGSVRVNGRDARTAAPGHVLGFSLDPPGMDPGHRATRHLEIVAVAAGVPRTRVDAVIDAYGLRDCVRQRVRSLSTGQRQRLALATTQLTEPAILVLDEPTNGLDADGVRWLRRALREHADAGGAVLISSHMLFEMEQIADEVVVLNRTVRYSGPLETLTDGGTRTLEDAYFDLLDDPHDAAAFDRRGQGRPSQTADPKGALHGAAV